MELDPQDVCKHGHQLAPGSNPITLRKVDDAGRETKQTLLLRRHAVDQSKFIADGMVPYPCGHGLKAHPDPTRRLRRSPYTDDQGRETSAYGGLSWGRSRYLDVVRGANGIPEPKCPICLDPNAALEQTNGDLFALITPADGSFDPREHPDLLPAWAAMEAQRATS